MSAVLHQRLPDTSTMLAGRGPVPPGLGVRTDRVQIFWRCSGDLGADSQPHAHERSDEFFLVLSGALTFEFEGRRQRVGPREYCHFPIGTLHRIAEVEAPIEALVIRAPSVEDKRFE